MSKTFLQSTAMRVSGALCLVILLAQCGTNPEAAKFFDDNNVSRVSVPHTGAISWEALDCSAVEYAAENGFSYFARADVTMKVVGGYAQPPAVLTGPEGDKRVFATYGFYRSTADWSSARDERIGEITEARVRAESCE